MEQIMFLKDFRQNEAHKGPMWEKCYLFWQIMVLNCRLWPYMTVCGLIWPYVPCMIFFGRECVTLSSCMAFSRSFMALVVLSFITKYRFYGLLSSFLAVIDSNSFNLINAWIFFFHSETVGFILSSEFFIDKFAFTCSINMWFNLKWDASDNHLKKFPLQKLEENLERCAFKPNMLKINDTIWYTKKIWDTNYLWVLSSVTLFTKSTFRGFFSNNVHLARSRPI